MKWFLPFLGSIFFGEILAKNTQFGTIINYLIGVTESFFYGYMFYNLSNKYFVKKIIIYFVPISVLGYLISFFFSNNKSVFFIANIVISGFFLAAIALNYLYEKFDDDETILISDSGFWIAIGVSLFYSGVSIVFSLHDFIVRNNLTLFNIKLYKLVPRILSVILYLSISISIILCKKKNKTLL